MKQFLEKLDLQESAPQKKSVRPLYKAFKEIIQKNNNKIYKTIGEVSKEININTPTLRFWEKEFKQIKAKL